MLAMFHAWEQRALVRVGALRVGQIFRVIEPTAFSEAVEKPGREKVT
jgi:hypothetical protein